MDSIKDRLDTELQTIAFTKQKKKELIHTVKSARRKKTDAPVWKYRAVLSAVIVLAIGFAFLSRTDGDHSVTTQAAGEESFSIPNLLAYDSVKTLLLAIVFLVVYGLFKRSIRKQGRSLPACANCGMTWSCSFALNKAFLKEKTTCPHCSAENYQTRKSRKKTSIFQLFIPNMIIMANVFNNGFIGMFVYLAFLAVFIVSLVPYYVELQKDDPMNEPWW